MDLTKELPSREAIERTLSTLHGLNIVSKPSGRRYYYYRHEGRHIGKLPDPFVDWKEFKRDYETLARHAIDIIETSAQIDTIDDLGRWYLASSTFNQIETESTKRDYRRAIDRLCDEVGDLRLEGLTAPGLLKVLGDIQEKIRSRGKGQTGRRTVKYIKSVWVSAAYAAIASRLVDAGLVNALTGAKIKGKSTPFRHWEESHVRKFRESFGLERRERLAFEVLLSTAMRGGDFVDLKLGNINIEEGYVPFVPSKTADVSPEPVLAPLSNFALDAIKLHFKLTKRPLREGDPNAATPKELSMGEIEEQPILTRVRKVGPNRHERWHTGMTKDAFRHMMGAAIRDAGLPANLHTHGLRVTAAVRLMEGGMTRAEIMEICGHRTMQIADRYQMRIRGQARAKKIANARDAQD